MHKNDLMNWRKQNLIDPLINSYHQRILNSDELTFIFPIWWEMKRVYQTQ